MSAEKSLDVCASFLYGSGSCKATPTRFEFNLTSSGTLSDKFTFAIIVVIPLAICDKDIFNQFSKSEIASCDMSAVCIVVTPLIFGKVITFIYIGLLNHWP